ncbi:hypothetical protein HaLaN_19026 [Haematococcus lacustris]|uniref:Uncharacterized protein n=1 Tax=Haematococcus lacustris TaxID=44745 RepID=A0A699ZGH6_HAELA|nr:hypothetical protein HaLaN_19026 [Haematococcus lacustris]
MGRTLGASPSVSCGGNVVLPSKKPRPTGIGRLSEGVAKRSELRAARRSQTAPTMSQRDMQHQAAADGCASAADGYSPASEAPPSATRLLDLPPVLLDDIACRVMQLGARSMLPLTCRAFSQARVLHAPALRIQLGRQCCDQLLTPQVVAALQARTSKLALTLWQPGTEDRTRRKEQLAPTLQLPQTEYTQDYTNLLAHALAKLDNCAAVEVCKLAAGQYWQQQASTGSSRAYRLRCPPGLAQHLLDSFPSLTALTLEGLCISSDALATLLSHPPLALQLQQLDIADIISQDGDEPGAVDSLFQGLRLKQLRIVAVYPAQPDTPPLRSFLPMAQHLTHLHIMNQYRLGSDLSFFVEYLQPLAQLQVLTISHLNGTVSHPNGLEGLAELLQALPQLHTLQLPGTRIKDQQQLITLLAATQITNLQLDAVDALDASYADAPCNWQRLELIGMNDRGALSCLPLHSLSQPLVLGEYWFSVDDILDPAVAASLHLLAEAIKVPVNIKELLLSMLPSEVRARRSEVGDNRFLTPAVLQQQRVDLAQLVALLQPLQCCGKVRVYNLHQVTAADVVALAPLCRDCTHFELYDGSIEPSLEFWHQLVQLMPALQKVTFSYVTIGVSKVYFYTAMHESLQLMAEQPWARWLDITIHDDLTVIAHKLPACWRAGSWLKSGIFKVTMWNELP